MKMVRAVMHGGTLLLLATAATVEAWGPQAAAPMVVPLQNAAAVSRSSLLQMKGKGSMGLPGKMRKGNNEDKQMKKRMQRRDFQRKEWVKVLSNIETELPEVGSTKAVTAGITPKGQDFIWCLVRGDESEESTRADDDGAATVFAIDGACRCCQFPMTAGKLNPKQPDGDQSISCGLCGTKYSLNDGNVVDFLPKENPAQWAAALVNEKKGPQRAVALPARVSKTGNVYVRLPDGTLLS